MLNRRSVTDAWMVLAAAALGVTVVQAQEITLRTSFPGRGWFNDIGFHRARNDNTFTGTVNPNPEGGSGRGLNSFFIWDLAPLEGQQVGTAKLRLGQDASFSADPSETIVIYDVSATRDELVAHYNRNSPAGKAIHDDLETGNEYGTFVTATGPQEYEVELTGQAVADINAALDLGYFALGLHNSTDAKSVQDGVRFDQPLRIHELTVTLGRLCSGEEKLTASCKKGKLKAVLEKGEPGATVTMCLDDEDCLRVELDNKGGAKVKWKKVPRGSHTVSVKECGVSKNTSC